MAKSLNCESKADSPKSKDCELIASLRFLAIHPAGQSFSLALERGIKSEENLTVHQEPKIPYRYTEEHVSSELEAANYYQDINCTCLKL